MERIDKIISNQLGYSRKEVKEILRAGRVTVNGKIIKNADEKMDSKTACIKIDGKEITIQKNIYLILNKPKGYVSATEDKREKTVLDLVPEKYLHRNLFPAGRLDKDTTGLMIITDDGIFAHEILSPKKHIPKTYLVKIDIPITEEMIKGFQEGVKLIDGICKASNLKKIDSYQGEVTLIEGRYHQIKRMFGVYKAKVLELKRIQMGKLSLPEDLLEGKCRELTSKELQSVIEREDSNGIGNSNENSSCY